jgi:nucleoside-diphosphate-sugar epimerase
VQAGGITVLTGATGFVGRHILRELTERGQRVRVLVRNRTRLNAVAYSGLAEVVETPDLFAEAPTSLQTLVAGADLLIHAAWYAEPGKYLTSPINVDCLEGTLRLAQAFSRAGGRRFVGLGTCAEYDVSEGILRIETALRPDSLYAACKASAFQVLSKLLPGQGVSFSWCRLFYLYGDGEDKRRLVPYIRKQLQAGEPAQLTSGNQVRDFIEVRKAARLIVELAMGDVQGAANICTGVPTTVRELAQRVADEYGRPDLLRFGARADNLFDPPKVVGVPGPFHG